MEFVKGNEHHIFTDCKICHSKLQRQKKKSCIQKFLLKHLRISTCVKKAHWQIISHQILLSAAPCFIPWQVFMSHCELVKHNDQKGAWNAPWPSLIWPILMVFRSKLCTIILYNIHPTKSKSKDCLFTMSLYFRLTLMQRLNMKTIAYKEIWGTCYSRKRYIELHHESLLNTVEQWFRTRDPRSPRGPWKACWGSASALKFN